MVKDLDQADRIVELLERYPGAHVFGYDTEQYSRSGYTTAEVDGKKMEARCITKPYDWEMAPGKFISKVQIGVPEGQSFVFCILAMGSFPPRLLKFLKNPRHWKVLHGASSERATLKATTGVNDMKMDGREGFIDTGELTNSSLAGAAAKSFPPECSYWIARGKGIGRRFRHMEACQKVT